MVRALAGGVHIEIARFALGSGRFLPGFLFRVLLGLTVSQYDCTARSCECNELAGTYQGCRKGAPCTYRGNCENHGPFGQPKKMILLFLWHPIDWEPKSLKRYTPKGDPLFGPTTQIALQILLSGRPKLLGFDMLKRSPEPMPKDTKAWVLVEEPHRV